MWVRSVRLLVAIGVGASLTLTHAGVARADPTLGLVKAGAAEAAARGTTAGIAMLDRVTGRYADNGANAHLRFESASLVKLFIADSVLRRARLGQLTLSSADRTAMGLMLRSSDDAAASNFWSRFGSSGIVTEVAARYGLTETLPPTNPRYWGRTQVTAHDLVRYYDGLLKGSGKLAAADRDYIVGQLRLSTAQGTDGVYQWFGLHDGLPRQPVIALKQGWMCCFSDGYIWRHSAGIVGKDSRYVVVVLAREPASLGSPHTTTSSTRVVQKMFPSGLVPRVQDAIGDRWYRMGGHASRLGLPTAQQLTLTNGAGQRFERGVIYWSPTTGARWVIGAIRTAWARQGWERGRLGYPTSDEIALTGGAYSRFQGGSVYWSRATGAHWVTGAIRTAWGRQGWERGHLGYPTTDQTPLPDGGAYNGFQGGAIYWSPTTDARWLSGPVLEAWAADGYEQGPLGYPTSDPYAVPDGTRVDFQHGSLTLTPEGDVVRVDSSATATSPGDTTDSTTTTTTSTTTSSTTPSTTSTTPTTSPSPTPAGTSTTTSTDSKDSTAATSDSSTSTGAAAPTATGEDKTP